MTIPVLSNHPDSIKRRNFGGQILRLFNARKALSLAGLIIAVLLFSVPPVKAVGILDPPFNQGKVYTGFGGRDYAADILIQPDGKFIVVGTSYFQPGTGADFALARYNIDGSLDTTFGTGGKVLIDISGLGNIAEAALLQPDGKIIVVGHIHNPSSAESDFALARVNSNGSLDTSFGTGGKVTTGFGVIDTAYDVGLQSNGKIVVVGATELSNSGNIAIARYNIDGSLDNSFGASGRVVTDVGGGTADDAAAVVIQPDDKIVVGGSSNFQIALLRYDSSGNLDSGFGAGGVALLSSGATEHIADIALQTDGKILAAGNLTAGSSDFLLLRCLSNGNLDSSFGSGGKTTTDFFGGSDSAYALALRADDKIAVTGNVQLGSSSKQDFGTALYNSDGSLAGKAVTDFLGFGDYPRAVAVQADGKILVAGTVETSSGTGNIFGLARYLSIYTSRTPFDFDGDGRADISVYRPSSASYWFTMRSSWMYPQPNQYDAVQFGLQGDVIVPADYNGDGTTDVAVWRPSNGNWYTSLNPAINYGAVHWGISGDIPVPGDYDVDGRADLAVYRPSNGTWYILLSSNGSFIAVNFGGIADKPVPQDYDGDGKTDIAYISLTGNDLDWHIKRSSDGLIVTTQFGINGDKAVPADYDGDGDADIAVFRPSTGNWYTSLNPATNYGALHWGQNGDVPVAADYDGDGKADIAVFRPSNRAWYVLKSVDSALYNVGWGLSTDAAVPSAYVP